MAHIAYFDNAATTFPKPEEVYRFMDKFYRECGVNVGRGQHKLAGKASKLIDDTRCLLLELNCCLNKKVVFTHTATEAMNIILQGIILSDNLNVYLSPFEHNAVTRVITHLKDIFKLNLFTLAVNRGDLGFNLEKIKEQFSDNKPNVVVISHANNICGVVAPIHQICSMSKLYKSVNIIDMCQTTGLIDTDLSSDIFDFAVFTGHKTLYGPLGVAGFICSGDLKPSPLLYGGTGIDSASQALPDTIPERYEVASPNIMAIAGLYAALQWIKVTGIDRIYQGEKENHRQLLEILGYYENINIVAPTDVETGTGVVSCVFNEFSSDSIGKVLSDNDIAVRTGLHCAPYAHKFLGTFPAGTVRFSVSFFNTNTDFEKLNQVLEYIKDNTYN